MRDFEQDKSTLKMYNDALDVFYVIFAISAILSGHIMTTALVFPAFIVTNAIFDLKIDSINAEEFCDWHHRDAVNKAIAEEFDEIKIKGDFEVFNFAENAYGAKKIPDNQDDKHFMLAVGPKEECSIMYECYNDEANNLLGCKYEGAINGANFDDLAI